MFHTLHLMFEEQYNELWLAGDVIAERIRALGYIAPGSYREFSKLSDLQETEAVSSAKEMIAELLRDHETCARRRRRKLFWLFAALAVGALLFDEQVAVLYVLSTLALCGLMM